MAEEKFRHEHPERPRMHTYARVLLILSVVQIVLSLGLHILAHTHQMLIMIVGVAALVSGVLAVFMWPDSRAFRNIVRGVLIGTPLVAIALGVFCIIAEKVYNPASTFLSNLSLYGSLAAWLTQIALVFGIPALVAAASFGARVDRVFLNIIAILNAVCVIFITYCASAVLGFDFTMDHAVVKAVYVLYTVVFAGLTFVPALGNDPDHTIKA